MIDELTRVETPKWLIDIVENDTMGNMPFPLESVLTDSLFYPACGLNGTPIKFLAGNVASFVYVDYAVSRKQYLENIHANDGDGGMLGYHIVAEREILRDKVIPEGWSPPLTPTGEDDKLDELQEAQSKCVPFGHWSIWERNDSSQGPRYISLFYLAGEACDTYMGLYNRTGIRPRILSIIQPGSGLGGGWTPIESDSGFFKRVVAANPAGLPEYLLHGGEGGEGGEGFYEEPCWQEYQSERIVQLPERYAGLWQLQPVY